MSGGRKGEGDDDWGGEVEGKGEGEISKLALAFSSRIKARFLCGCALHREHPQKCFVNHIE